MDEDDYLQKITEIIYDDNEIVTCSILSKKLKIKVQDAQNLLDKYVANADVPEQNDLSWMYMMVGTNGNNGYMISIWNQEELEKKRDSLKSIISQHVYSVHRKGSVDWVTLANAEPFAEHKIRNEPLLGCIVSKNAVIRKLKVKLVINEIKQEDGKTESKQIKTLGTKPSASKPKKNGIESFCTKGNSANFISKPIINAKTQQKNMMANFISKSFTKPKENGNHSVAEEIIGADENLSDENEKTQEESVADVNKEVDNQLNEKDEIVINTNKNASEKKESIKEKANKGKKRKSQSKSKQTSKKRKRIVEADHSDSDIFASSESEIEVNPDVYLSDDNSSVTDAALPTKARRMKQITEEFMDEDGYMNTVQKYIMASDDEDEEFKEQKPLNILPEKLKENPTKEIRDKSLPASKKETSTKNGKGKNASRTTKAQPSITNFFKKI